MNSTTWIIVAVVIALVVYAIVRRRGCGCGDGKVCSTHTTPSSGTQGGAAGTSPVAPTSTPTSTPTM
ncbi:MAG: hypothetical protein V4526_02855 [Patescibacteria group bacterium]